MATWPGDGLKIGMGLNLFFALAAFVMVYLSFRERRPVARDRDSAWRLWREMDTGLKRLLLAESLARWAEEMGRVFVILYVCDFLHHSRQAYSGLMAIRGGTELLVYLILARVTDHLNRKPFVVLAFAFFSLCPFLLAVSSSWYLLQLAFVASGLSRIGEPARKALIVDLARYTARGRVVGLYYLMRGLAVAPAPLIGGLLWKIEPRLPFAVGACFGAASVLIYVVWGPTLRPAAHEPTHVPIPLPPVRAPGGSSVVKRGMGASVSQPVD